MATAFSFLTVTPPYPIVTLNNNRLINTSTFPPLISHPVNIKTRNNALSSSIALVSKLRRRGTVSVTATKDNSVSELDGNGRKIAQSLLWFAEGVYIIWLFLLPFAPGDPVWAISKETIDSLIGLSLNFFFVLPLSNSIGIHIIEAPVLHPMSEGLFNLVIGWTLMFAPLLYTDKRRDRYTGSLDVLWGFQMFLTNTFLIPYMAIRLNDPGSVSSPRKTSQLGSVMTNGASIVGVVGGIACLVSVVWALYGRGDGNYGNLPERWEFLLSYLGSERLAYAFIWDICLYTVFQPWLIGDNLQNIQQEKLALVSDSKDFVKAIHSILLGKMSKERLLPIVSLEGNDGETGNVVRFKSIRGKFVELRNNLSEFSEKALAIGGNDHRKIIYAMKMGFALSLVSLFIFWKKPADLSQFAIWAILTVVVMFEFSIGATFIKGFNRGLGTFFAGMLAFFFAWLALMAGEREKVVIVLSFFIIGACGSYLRFYPGMGPYDYGFRVFVLTYCILMVAGNRTREYVVAILTRLVLIAVGGCFCFVINIFIYPIWSGDDLHRLVVNNFNELATSLEGCVNGYLKYADYDRTTPRSSTQKASSEQYLGYKLVIESASREQNLLGFAVWEPPHGRYRSVRNPWNSYVKVSTALRHCSYSVMALHGCILSEIQAPPEKRQMFRIQLQNVSAEGAKVLREIGNKIEKMEKLGADEHNLTEVHEAAQQLQKKIDQRSYLLVNSEDWEIKSQTKELEDLNEFPVEKDYHSLQLGIKSLSETSIYVKSPFSLAPRLANKDFTKRSLRKHVPWPSWISYEGDGLIKEDEVKTYQSASSLSLATFASLLIEFVARLQNVVDCFDELSEEAGFRDPDIVILSPAENISFWKKLLRCRFKN